MPQQPHQSRLRIGWPKITTVIEYSENSLLNISHQLLIDFTKIQKANSFQIVFYDIHIHIPPYYLEIILKRRYQRQQRWSFVDTLSSYIPNMMSKQLSFHWFVDYQCDVANNRSTIHNIPFRLFIVTLKLLVEKDLKNI